MRDLQKEDRLAIFSLSAGHFISDAYSNFLGPLLPLLVLKLNLSIAQAGWLAAMQVISSSLTQPAYGYLSDRYLKRLFAVFSPTRYGCLHVFPGGGPELLYSGSAAALRRSGDCFVSSSKCGSRLLGQQAPQRVGDVDFCDVGNDRVFTGTRDHYFRGCYLWTRAVLLGHGSRSCSSSPCSTSPFLQRRTRPRSEKM